MFSGNNKHDPESANHYTRTLFTYGSLLISLCRSLFLACPFSGKVMHSHSYRCPEPFAHQSVVVLGAGASGVDISFELAHAKAQVKQTSNTK